MRYLGVDLHPTNFVVCFLSAQGKSRVVTFALTVEGVTAFRRQLRADEAVAVEAEQTAHYFYDHIHRAGERSRLGQSASLRVDFPLQEENGPA